MVCWKNGILCLDCGGPFYIPAVDKGKNGDAEDGQQLDRLVGRAALGEEGLEGVDGEGEGNDGNGCRHDDDALHPHPEKDDGSGTMLVLSPNEGWKSAKSNHDVGVVGSCKNVIEVAGFGFT